jgi:uncharacterized membrane protein YfcA
VTPGSFAIGVAIGLASGVLSGIFGVGGGIVMTPGVQVLLGAPPVVALATPLPAIFPTALAGALAYRRRGELDPRVAAWLAGPGLLGAALGAWVTEWVDTSLLLLATAGLLGWQAIGVVRTRPRGGPEGMRPISNEGLAAVGAGAGFLSGLLGIGGGIVIVPFLAGWLGMPLKRALGTSLLAIVALVVPGTVVHAMLGHIDLWIVAALTIGAVPGARIGAGIALGARERTLRVAVGLFLLVVAVGYALAQLIELLGR